MAYDGPVAGREDLNNKQHVARTACFTNHESIPTYLIYNLRSQPSASNASSITSEDVPRTEDSKAITRYAPEPEIASGCPASSRCC